MKHYLRYTTLFLIALVLSCGSGDTPVGQGVGQDFSLADSGGIAPKIQWDYRNPFNSPLSKGDRGLSNTIHHKAPLGVYKVRATLLDTSNNPVSGFQTTKDVAPGDSGTITFTSVPAGTYNAKLEGLDSTGSDVLYTGQTNGIGVTANQVAEPSVIARYTRADNASPGSSGHSPANGTTNIPANTKISVQVSDNDAGVDATSIVLTVNNENVTSKSSIIGTSDNYTVLYTPSTNLSGTVTVTLRASDLANPANSMTTETWSFTISSSGTTDTTAPASPSISFGSATTSSQLATATISATDDTGVTGYYLSESSTTPSITSSGWTSVTSTTSYNANVNWTLSSGNGTKTVYVWFKDAVGNISASANTSITLNQTDTTAPTNPSISINSGGASTTTTSVTLTLSASDDTGVTGYYVSESTITPSLTSANWVSVTSAASYSATAAFTLSGGSVGDNTKTVYVWFKDSAGNISASASDSITLTISDSTAPSSPSISIDSGASSTTSTSVTLTLSATDNIGVTGYYASETSTTPSASASGWTSVTSTTSYSASVSFTLSSSSGTKTVYVWFKDSAGNVSSSVNDTITLADITTGLVAYYPFNGNANDESGNGYNGTVTGAVSISSGKFDMAYSFDGSGDYIDYGNINNFDRTDSFTISSWVKRGATGIPHTIVSKRNDSAGTGYAFYIDSANKLDIIFGKTNVSDSIRLNSTLTFTDSNWHHFVITYDGSSSAAGVKLYADGELLATNTDWDTLTSSMSNSYNFRIGDVSDSGGCGCSMNGTIDEVRIYNRVLSASEISTLSGTSGSAPSAPSGVTAIAGSSQVSISWSSVSDATSYNIYWSTTTGVTKTTGTKITGATSSYTHSGLTNGTPHYYVVTAVNSYGESSESSQVSATATPLKTNLVAYYKLEDANDSYGSNNLTNNNGVAFSAGKVNNASNFVKTSSQILKTSSPLSIDGGTCSFSVWFKLASFPGGVENDFTIFQQENTSSKTYIALMYENVGGAYYLRFYRNRTGIDGAVASYQVNLTIGTWYQAVCTYNGSTGDLFLYLNNVNVATANGTGNGAYPDRIGFGIGGVVAGIRNFDGSVDELGVWTKVLSSAEIAELYNNGNGWTLN